MEKAIKVPHPSNDGTWVEFHGTSARQKEVLEHYQEIWEFIKQNTKDEQPRKPRTRTR